MSKTLETVREAARHTGLPERRLYELVSYARDHPGEPDNIPFVTVGSRIYFRTGRLDGWLDALEGAIEWDGRNAPPGTSGNGRRALDTEVRAP